MHITLLTLAPHIIELIKMSFQQTGFPIKSNSYGTTSVFTYSDNQGI